VPLVAAAVCPFPPLIVPEIAVGAAAETDGLRAACDAAVATLAASGARRLVIVGSDDTTRDYEAAGHASFARWGAPVGVRVGDGSGGPCDLPLSLLIGAWLAARGFGDDEDVAVTLTGVAADEDPQRCAALLDGHPTAGPWALLAMGDGSACRGLTSPGYDDPRAAPYDEGVASALAGADAEALLRLDPVLSTELKVAGRAPWQVLAGAVRATGHAWHGEVSFNDAPYGVNYLVATWTPA
jgi:hypothetical protein